MIEVMVSIVPISYPSGIILRYLALCAGIVGVVLKFLIHSHTSCYQAQDAREEVKVRTNSY